MTPFDAPGKQAFWKHNFSFSHSVFYLFGQLSSIFVKFDFFSLEESKICRLVMG